MRKPEIAMPTAEFVSCVVLIVMEWGLTDDSKCDQRSLCMR